MTWKEKQDVYLKVRRGRIRSSRLVKEYENGFKHARHAFDREYRKCKRQWERSKGLELEEQISKDPKEFWKFLNNLGNRKKQNGYPLGDDYT